MRDSFVKCEAFDVVLPLPRPLTLGAISISHREYVVARIHDNFGNTGTAIGLTRQAPVAQTILRNIGKHIEGCDLREYPNAYNTAVGANVCLGTNGIFWRALSLMDCAVHDLLARKAKVPLWQLLKGTPRDVPCILVGGYPTPTETFVSLENEMRRFNRLGPAGVKIGSCGDFSEDTNRLDACRRALPDGPPLMIDLYWQCSSPDQLLEQAMRWTPFRMGWIEDPMAFDDYQGTAKLADSLPYPVAVGDEQSGFMHFGRLIDQGKVKVVRLDATVCGGITAFLAIAKAAAQKGVPVSCHIYPELHVQLAAVADNVRWVETFLPDAGLDSMHLVTRNRPVLRDSCMHPSTAPGCGIDFDEEGLSRYRAEESHGTN